MPESYAVKIKDKKDGKVQTVMSFSDYGQAKDFKYKLLNSSGGLFWSYYEVYVSTLKKR